MAAYLFITLAIVAIVLPAVAMATEHIVGDDAGWTIHYNYTAWAQDKVFYLGDTLVFKYTPPNHNVIKVNATEFQNCTASKLETPLTSGHDVITLSIPGKKWYICGKVTGDKKHCDLGQKLVINVSDAPAPSPSPSRTPSPSPSRTPSPSPTPTPSPSPTPSHNAASGIMSSPVFVVAVVFMAMIMV